LTVESLQKALDNFLTTIEMKIRLKIENMAVLCLPQHKVKRKLLLGIVQNDFVEARKIIPELFSSFQTDCHTKLKRLYDLWFQQTDWKQEDKEEFARILKELLAGSRSLPLCEKCKKPMKVVQTRDDGCRYFECPQCGQTMGEETEEWFKEQQETDQK